MSSNKPLMTFNVTEEQRQAIAAGIKASGLSKSEFFRFACWLACQEYGVEFPENMPPHGGPRVLEIGQETT